jgi:pyruvate dehydrogenase E2 component (dihydrolipoamide acetyltransferase)
MAISVVMPALEMAQETGKLISWLKKEGDSVTKGEPLLEVETDKAVMEIESPGDGILAGVNIGEGAEVPVGRTIAWIVRPGEPVPVEKATAATGRKTAMLKAAEEKSEAQTKQEEPASRSMKISPKARRLAAERGIDLTQIRGSGPGGEILASDIPEAAHPKADTSPAPLTSMSAISRLMAERTTESWKTVPHFFLQCEVDAGPLNEARKRLGEGLEKSRGVKLTHSDLLVALVARVIAKHPFVNASWTAGGIHQNSEINIGLAMAVDDGVIVPVIRSADRARLEEIAALRHDLAERGRCGKLRPADLSGGTFTISNLGMFGVDSFTAIIIPPQAAILAVGAIADRVVAIDGSPAVRLMMTLTLSSDHRVLDGARSAAFMKSLAQAIADPLSLL